MLICAPIIGLWYWCTDQYIVQRALGARTRRRPAAARSSPRFLKLLPVFIFIIPGMHLLGAGQEWQGPGAGAALVDANGNVGERAVQAAFPLMVMHVLPAGVRGMVVAGSARGADELARRRVQRLVDAVHDGPLSKVSPECVAASARVDRPHGDDRDGADRHRLDSGDPELRAGSTTICRACKAIWRRRSSSCSSWACSGSGSTRRAAWRRCCVGFLLGLFRLAVDTPSTFEMRARAVTPKARSCGSSTTSTSSTSAS